MFYPAILIQTNQVFPLRGKQECVERLQEPKRIRCINIRDSEAEIDYTCPIGLTGNRRNEVLSMAKIGSLGQSKERTFKITVSLNLSGRGKLYRCCDGRPSISNNHWLKR
jgi:hypothetical protein